MLLSLRDRVKGSKWLGTAVVVVISIPFALFGIGSYFGGGGDNYAAKVNDEEISIRTYEQNYYAQRNQLRAAFGGKIPQGFDSATFLRQQALEKSITRTLLQQHVNDYGYAIGNQTLASQLYNEAVFQENGQFSRERYERQLQSQGLIAQQFEEQLKQDLAVNQVREGVLSSSFQITAEFARIEALKNQLRTFSFININADLLGELEAPDEASIEAYFAANPRQFKHAKKVKLEYIELEQEQLAQAVDVDEDTLREIYLSEKGKYVLPERRNASHILIVLNDGASDTEIAEKKQIIEELRQRILAGESFVELAKAFSEDPGSVEQGGDLGEFPRGAMVPEFEQEAFSLEVDEISDIVQSSFGFHLIKLNEIIPEQGKSFEQARQELEQAYRTQEAEQLFSELSEVLSNQAYENSDTLEAAAEALNIDITQTDWLNANENNGIFRYPVVKPVAFSVPIISEQLNSEVINIDDNHAIVLRMVDYRPSEVKPLGEVRDQIQNILITEQREDKLKEMAEKSFAALNKGDTLIKVSEIIGADVSDEASISRDDKNTDSNVVSELFRIPKPTANATYSMVKTLSGGYAVIALSAVTTSTLDKDGPSVAGNEEEKIGRSEYTVWLLALRERANVTINKQLLDDIAAQQQ